MKFRFVILLCLVAGNSIAYPQSDPAPSKPNNCVCDNSKNSGTQGLPYDPCSNMPNSICSILWETCVWDENSSKCAFKYWPSGRNQTLAESTTRRPIFGNLRPLGNGTFPNIPGIPGIPSIPKIPGLDQLPDPCQRNPTYICLILREACKWNEEKNVCQLRSRQ